jgi:hypothetical protein
MTAAELLGRAVRLRGIRLGRPVDLVLDRDRTRVLGFDVRCGDEEQRFLPLAAARLENGEIEVSSSLVLVEGAEVAYYREQGCSFASLRGRPVGTNGGEAEGELVDLGLSDDGTIEVAVVAGPSGTERVPYRELRLLDERSRPARSA